MSDVETQSLSAAQSSRNAGRAVDGDGEGEGEGEGEGDDESEADVADGGTFALSAGPIDGDVSLQAPAAAPSSAKLQIKIRCITRSIARSDDA